VVTIVIAERIIRLNVVNCSSSFKKARSAMKKEMIKDIRKEARHNNLKSFSLSCHLTFLLRESLAMKIFAVYKINEIVKDNAIKRKNANKRSEINVSPAVFVA